MLFSKCFVKKGKMYKSFDDPPIIKTLYLIKQRLRICMCTCDNTGCYVCHSYWPIDCDFVCVKFPPFLHCDD